MDAFTFEFEGRPIAARRGETIAGALMRAGVDTVRDTRIDGRPRGVFCAMGVCFDCVAVVDGCPNVRTCVTAVQPGMCVRRQRGTA